MSDDTEIEEAEDTDGYGPPADDPMTFEASEAAYGRGRLVLVLVVVMVFAAVAIFFAVYQQGTRERGKTTPPVITAEKGPTKVEPEDPGGMVVEHQDKLVYDKVSGEERQQVEVLLPESEEPVDLSGLRTAEEEAKKETAKIIESAAKSEEKSPLPPEENVVIETVDMGPSPQTTTKEAEPAPVKTTTPKPAGPKPAEVMPATTQPSAASGQPATSGSHVVQVAAFPEAELAAKAWETLKAKHGPVVGNMRPDIQVADLGDKGVWYRLRVGPFASKSTAQDACNKLKARGQECLVRTP